MRSNLPGTPISAVEVTKVSARGLWLLADGGELFLDFEDFPAFRNASIAQMAKVTEPSPGHYYWPELDIDVGLASIRHPERFPLIAK
ncbi:MAG: DUF2442 domain-containing protein [Betaproteobacteria bacterium]|nr:DUF2442 domain-containing protein [Betaproteobacteria bacterium]